MIALLQVLIAVAAAAPTTPDGADSPERTRRSDTWDAWGEARLRSESAPLSLTPGSTAVTVHFRSFAR